MARLIGPVLVLAMTALLGCQVAAAPPPAAPTPPVAPTIAPETPYPTPSPFLGGTRSSTSALVGEEVTLTADGRDADGWFQGVKWTLEDPAVARFAGPDTGASVTLQVLAPGPIRVRTSRDGKEVKTLLAGVASPAPGRAIDLGSYGVNRPQYIGGAVAGTMSEVVTTEAGWRAFTSQKGIPEGLRSAPPPVDFATSSIVAVFEGLPNITDPSPVFTRVDPAPPGFAEVVHPIVEHMAGRAPAFANYLALFEVARMPDGAAMRVVRN